jgi:hypothetical protein
MPKGSVELNPQRRISDISGLCDQLMDQLKTSRSALQADQATNVLRDPRLFIYVWYVLKHDKGRLFCKPTDGTATSLEMFNTRGPFERFVDYRQCAAVMQGEAVIVMPRFSGGVNIVVA